MSTNGEVGSFEDTSETAMTKRSSVPTTRGADAVPSLHMLQLPAEGTGPHRVPDLTTGTSDRSQLWDSLLLAALAVLQMY